MSIFQKSVVQKYLKALDEKIVNQAYETFNNYFKDHFRLSNIMQLKEENYQEGFLRELFVEVLGYTINPNKNFNLTTEFKNQTDSKKADGAILKDNQAIGVIELKSTKLLDLKYIEKQAFNYKNNQPNCRYVITSTFRFLRLYIDNSTQYEEFDLFYLDYDNFKLLYLFLSKDSIFNEIPLRLKDETKFHEENITVKFYKVYKQFKEQIFNDLVKNNKQYDKILLLKKTQKLLDRILFIAFAEDKGLLPPNALSRTIDKWKNLIKEGDNFSLYSRYQLFFGHLNVGFTIADWGVIPAYNGGLFATDDILDNKNLIIADKIIQEGVLNIAKYDFNTEIDVNILGHIFEHSLNELDEIKKELTLAKDEASPNVKIETKRKKDGVFYTPDYITKYIVENTIGKLCEKNKEELNLSSFQNQTGLRDKKGKLSKVGKEYFESLQKYKYWLFDLKIIDPACGSGAFLIATLDFLISEHKQTDDLLYQLTGEAIKLFDTDKTILEKNIYGVDINEESVEIAKLSLWLHTAKKERKLSDLSGNIKCGNSLIDNKKIAGEKAFIWETEFSEIMQNGGFDCVIANPPYVDNRGFNKEVLQFLYKNYPNSFEKTGTEKYKTTKLNLIAPFFELTGKILKEEGYSGWIFHKNILKTNAYTSIRKYILKNNDILNITDWGAGQFADVIAETASISFKKTNKINDKIEVNFYKYNLKIETEIQSQNSFQNSYNYIFSIYKNSKDYDIIEAIEKCKSKLSEIININNGIVTGNDKIFISNKKENDFYKPTLRGKDFKRYSILIPQIYVNYDKSKLLRARDENIFLAKEKLIMQMINTDFVLTYDNQNFYNLGTTYAITNKSQYNIKAILAILNSKLITYYYKKKFTNNSTLTNAISTQNLFLIPFPEIKNETEIVEIVDKILHNNNEIYNLKTKFLNRIFSNFDNVKINNKINEYYKFDFKTFQAELSKQNIKLKLNQQDEWEEYFTNNKKLINEKNVNYEIFLKELDLQVYNLYNLTPEEITIIENAK